MYGLMAFGITKPKYMKNKTLPTMKQLKEWFPDKTRKELRRAMQVRKKQLKQEKRCQIR